MNECDLNEVREMTIQKFKELSQDLGQWELEKHSDRFLKHKSTNFRVYFDSVFDLTYASLSLNNIEVAKIHFHGYPTDSDFIMQLATFNQNYIIAFIRRFHDTATCNALRKALQEKKQDKKRWWSF